MISDTMVTMSNKDDETKKTNAITTNIADNPTVRKNLLAVSEMINTGLSKESLDICIRLCEAGLHPLALAEVVNQIRREVTTTNDE